jgi:hypothetical protein
MRMPNILNVFQSGISDAQHPKPDLDWPEPEPLRNTLLDVTPLPSCNIPEPYRDWISDVAERMQCPTDFIAVAAIVTTAAVIGTGCGIKPKQKDDWLVIPNLWGGIVGRPGMLKTPAVSEVMQLIKQLEVEAKKSYDVEVSNYQADLELHKADREAIKLAMLASRKQAIKNKSNNDSFETLSLKEQLRQSGEPQKPIWKRYKTNDATVEKLSELLTDNPRGLLLYRDELVGLLASWEREGREGDRAFFLESWNGDGSLTTDRIGRGTVHVENLCLSIFGNTQPAKLSRYLYHAIRGADNDGLLQRFQLLIYPDDKKEWKLIDRVPNYYAKEKAANLFRKLVTMNFVEHGAIKGVNDRFPYFHYDNQAQDIFNEWYSNFQQKKLYADEQPILIEHLSKYSSLVPSLSLIFHLINIADGKSTSQITSDALLMAIGWCGYLEKHARRIYAMANNVVYQSALRLGKKIQEGEVASLFSVRDIYRKEWTMLDEKSVVQKACEELVDIGWIRLESQSYEFGRPRSSIYKINPKLKIRNASEDNFF